ncbi:glycoside hydrolase family 18 protein [Streptomyces olivaceus]|uniref:glycoside hydrolase family 18 protein n=1 Tax=Streptomyces olivaceus TaxID=47716 RepID=UPI00099C7A2B|nr:glycoside hydrolase family 18 protein [Streptomyces olivaceus]MBZ6103201.1 glycoside hydrolase family 18 protein [Streptomyces olivaceus]
MEDTEPRPTEPRRTEPAPADTDSPPPGPPAPADTDQPPPGPPAPADAGRPSPVPPAPADGDSPPPGPPAPADTDQLPPVPPAPDDESRTVGAGGNKDAEAEAKATPRKRPRIRRKRTALAVLLVLLLPLLVAETALRVNYLGDPADGTRTRGRDALWLGHAWVDGRKTEADLTALARNLKTTGIRDLYVHTGPMEHDGTLPEALYPKAHWLIDGVHRELPGVRVQAFLGDVLATESPDGMRLEQAATRAAVVDSARQVLDVGYDGVHLDLEPLHSGDRDYLSLLDDVRAVTRPRGAQLSVAAHQIDPLPGFHSFWGTVAGHPKWWSQEFFGRVARRVDQIAVMSYDTMQPLESLYGGYVAQQTSLALEVTPPTTHLLMGLPFYQENRFGHWAHAETVAAAVRGVRLGLSRTDADRERFGVAAYIDFAATDEDWASYRSGWVG